MAGVLIEGGKARYRPLGAPMDSAPPRERHGEGPQMVEQMRKKGDKDGANTWLRIIVAIGDLGTPPTEARH
jgi:hypothetical protein